MMVCIEQKGIYLVSTVEGHSHVFLVWFENFSPKGIMYMCGRPPPSAIIKHHYNIDDALGLDNQLDFPPTQTTTKKNHTYRYI